MYIDVIKGLVSLPATDLNFVADLERATENQIRLAIEMMEQSGGKNKGRIAACKRELRRREQMLVCMKNAAREPQRNAGWIPVSERLPKPEEEVLVTAICRYKDGGRREIVTPAIYEDGTVLECNSNWYWEEIDGEWDKENDCLIIPKGWFENRKYNPDSVYNCAIDDEVVAWMPLPEPYRESEA